MTPGGARTGKCPSCGNTIAPVVNDRAGGGLSCPLCRAALVIGKPRAASAAPADVVSRLPRPLPKAVRPAVGGATAAGQRLSGIRPPRPRGAVALPPIPLSSHMVSSSPWVPDPDPGPSPDATRDPYAAPGNDGRRAGLLYSPTIWFVIVGLLLALGVSVGLLLKVGPTSRITGITTPPRPQLSSDHPRQAPIPAELTKDATVASLTLPPGARVVNLMDYIDPARDAVAGQWERRPDGLASDNALAARLGIPYDPPDEYDFRIEFTRTVARDCVTQTFTAAGHPCAWLMGGWKGDVCGFEMIDGKLANANATMTRGVALAVEARHVSVVRVRKGRVEAYVDGKLIASHKTDGADLGVRKDWDVHPDPLGVGSHLTPTVFHRIELVEVSGRGHAPSTTTVAR